MSAVLRSAIAAAVVAVTVGMSAPAQAYPFPTQHPLPRVSRPVVGHYGPTNPAHVVGRWHR